MNNHRPLVTIFNFFRIYLFFPYLHMLFQHNETNLEGSHKNTHTHPNRYKDTIRFMYVSGNFFNNVICVS